MRQFEHSQLQKLKVILILSLLINVYHIFHISHYQKGESFITDNLIISINQSIDPMIRIIRFSYEPEFVSIYNQVNKNLEESFHYGRVLDILDGSYNYSIYPNPRQRIVFELKQTFKFYQEGDMTKLSSDDLITALNIYKRYINEPVFRRNPNETHRRIRESLEEEGLDYFIENIYTRPLHEVLSSENKNTTYNNDVLYNEISLGIEPSDHGAIQTVKTNLRAKKDNDFEVYVTTLYDDPGNIIKELGVISLVLHEIVIDNGEAEYMKNYYSGSDLALRAGWSDEHLEKNMVVVRAFLTVDYDNTKVFYDGGTRTEYYMLMREDYDAPWRIWQGYSFGKYRRQE